MTENEIHQKILQHFRDRTCAQQHIRALQKEIEEHEKAVERLDWELVRIEADANPAPPSARPC